MTIPPVTTLLRRLSSAPWRLYRRPLAVAAASAVVVIVVLSQSAPVPTTTVVVVERAITAGSVIVAGDVTVAQRPTAHLPDGVTGSDPVGRVVTTDLVVGEIIVEARLGRPGTSGPGALLPPNRVGVSVPRDAAPPGVAVGDHLDLVAVSIEGPSVIAHAAPVVAADETALAVAVPIEAGPAVVDAVLGGWLIPMLSSP